MAWTVQQIITDALSEIGALGVGETPSGPDAALALRYLQRQLDSWQADRLLLSRQGQTAVSWPAATSTQTVGPGGQINRQRPLWIETVTYSVPGTSPAVEVVLAHMDADQYAAKSIKALPSLLPTSYFYQSNLTDTFGQLYLWPQPTGTLTLTLYVPEGVDVPASYTTVLNGPPGYQDAFLYDLALRLCRPFGKPITPDVQQAYRDAIANAKRPNVEPGRLGVDAALTHVPGGGGYNVLSDQHSSSSR